MAQNTSNFYSYSTSSPYPYKILFIKIYRLKIDLDLISIIYRQFKGYFTKEQYLFSNLHPIYSVYLLALVFFSISLKPLYNRLLLSSHLNRPPLKSKIRTHFFSSLIFIQYCFCIKNTYYLYSYLTQSL